MRCYRLGAHTESDLKNHVAWIPNSWEAVLTGEVPPPVEELVRQISSGHELEIIFGKVACDPVHAFLSYRPTQEVSQIIQWRKGRSSRVLLQEFPRLWRHCWGRHLWALGYLAVSSGNITPEMIREYIDEQEGRQMAHGS